MIGAIILAAGRSTRMGRSKPLLPHGPAGETLLKHQVDTLKTAGLRHILVVGRPDDTALHDEVARCSAGLALNPGADGGGQLSSLQVGLRTFEEAFGFELEGVLVMPTDVPFVSSTGIARLLELAKSSTAAVLRATHEGRHGHPVLFKREVFGELYSADQAVGARAVIRADPARVQEVDLGEAGVTIDVDTPEDYRRYFGRLPSDS